MEKKVKLITASYKDVYVYYPSDLRINYSDTFPVERGRTRVINYPSLELDYITTDQLKIHRVCEFTNKRSDIDDLIAIHPSLSRILIPSVLNEECVAEYERMKSYFTTSDKRYQTVALSNHNKGQKLKGIFSMPFWKRFKFLIQGEKFKYE